MKAFKVCLFLLLISLIYIFNNHGSKPISLTEMDLLRIRVAHSAASFYSYYKNSSGKTTLFFNDFLWDYKYQSKDEYELLNNIKIEIKENSKSWTLREIHLTEKIKMSKSNLPYGAISVNSAGETQYGLEWDQSNKQ